MEEKNPVKDIVNITNKWENRLSWNDYFMSLAFLASSRSPCSRLHVGCVLVKDNRVMSMGYNGFLPKAPHESCIRDNHEQAIVHSEQNAVCHAARNGINIHNSTAYITHYPCINCTKVLCSSGIHKIYYHLNYKNDELVQKILSGANIEIKQI